MLFGIMYSYLVISLVSWQCVQITCISVECGSTQRDIDRLDTFLLGHCKSHDRVISHVMTPLHKQSNDEADQLSWWPCSHRGNPAPSGQTDTTLCPAFCQAHPNALKCILKTLTGSRKYLKLFPLNYFVHQSPTGGTKQNGAEKCHRRD